MPTIALHTQIFFPVIFLPYKEEAIFPGPIYDRLTYTDFVHVIFLPKEEAIFLGMKVYTKNDKTAILGYGDNQVCIVYSYTRVWR
jgi:hypothetical protein